MTNNNEDIKLQAEYLKNSFINLLDKTNLDWEKPKERNLGTNQVPMFEKFINQIKHNSKGYIKIEKEINPPNNPRFKLQYVSNGEEKDLNISSHKDNFMASSTLRQKLEILFYAGVIEKFYEGKSISTAENWKSKIHFTWDSIPFTKYNKWDLYILSFLNEKRIRLKYKMRNNNMSQCFLFCIAIFYYLIDNNNFLIKNSLGKNINKRGKNKSISNDVIILKNITDAKNNFLKNISNMTSEKYQNDKRELLRLLSDLLNSLIPNPKWAFIYDDLIKVNHKVEAKRIIDEINNGNVRTRQNFWKWEAIQMRKNIERKKDDLNHYNLNETHKVEAAHIFGVKDMKENVLNLEEQGLNEENCKSIIQEYKKCWNKLNALIIPVGVHRDLDHKKIKIIRDGKLYDIDARTLKSEKIDDSIWGVIKNNIKNSVFWLDHE